MKTDWIKIRNVYIEGQDTQQAIAEKFKVKYDTIRHKASKENWPEQRKLFQAKVQNLRTEKRSEIMATDIAQFDSDSLKLARAGYAMVAAEMKSNNPLKAPVHQLATALANFQKVGKLALGEVVDQDKEVKITVEYENGSQG